MTPGAPGETPKPNAKVQKKPSFNHQKKCGCSWSLVFGAWCLVFPPAASQQMGFAQLSPRRDFWAETTG
jgi:hypothetical protein